MMMRFISPMRRMLVLIMILASTLPAVLGTAAQAANAQTGPSLLLTADITNPRELTTLGDTLFFTGNGGLYTSNGTVAGTRLIKANIAPSNLQAVGTTLFFQNTLQEAVGPTLWKSDGTSTGTVPVKSFPNQSRGSIAIVTAVNGVVLVTAEVKGKLLLWRSDGTAVGTTTLRPELAGNIDGVAHAVVRQQLVFAGYAPECGLWNTDGTTTNTALVRDGLCPQGLVTLGDQVLFINTNPAQPLGLWASDGTAAGTRLVRELAPGAGNLPLQLTTARDQVYFTRQATNNSAELWHSDGSTTGTGKILDLGLTEVCSFSSAPLRQWLMFSQTTAGAGCELWHTDGSASGTQPSTNRPSTSPDAAPQLLTNIRETLLFIDAGAIWRTNGTIEGTAKIQDLPDIDLEGFTRAGTFVFFSAQHRLWAMPLDIAAPPIAVVGATYLPVVQR